MRTIQGAWFLLACLLVVGCGAAQGQEEPPKPAFPQLFAQPTGRNGYEELVMAGDLARAAEARGALLGEGTSLTELRAGLNEPDRQRALVLLRLGLSKPIRQPRARLDINTTFPELGNFRSLARLLAVEIHIRFADGRTADALASLRDGLRLSALQHGETLIGSLVGIAIDSIVLTAFAKHLDQLSARDCDRLLALARQRLKEPDPAIAAIGKEYQAAYNTLMDCRDDPQAARKLARDIFGDEAFQEIEDDYGPLLHAILNNPAALRQIVEGTISRLGAFYDGVIENLRRPPWQREAMDYKPDDTAMGQLANLFAPAFNMATRRFTEDRVRVQLLGVHAAIRRYRWEHDRLPAGLEDLKLGALATDAFTGKPLVYRQTGETTYTLNSAGAADGESGERLPVFLPPPPK